MKEIRMVDLYGQYRHIRKEIDEAMQGVLESTAFINGPAIGEFSARLEQYLGVRHVIPCANGTDALQLALMALDLQPGDEVITPDFTFIATVEAIALLGMKPVLADVDPGTFNITPSSIEKLVGPKTRAIIPVHLFGQCAEMEPILDIAREHRLYVIEDTAQALGADYIGGDGRKSKAGTLGTIGCTSFFPSKSLGCYGDGGACFTNDDRLAEKIRSTANHGMAERYRYDRVGINSRLDTLQAAVLKVKLKFLDEYHRRRQRVAEVYDQALKQQQRITLPARSSFSTHIFHQYTLKLHPDDRDRLKEYLRAKGIPTMIYYPSPLHTQVAYRYLGYQVEDFPVTGRLCRQVLSLPVHTEMEEDQQLYIIESILEFFQKH